MAVAGQPLDWPRPGPAGVGDPPSPGIAALLLDAHSSQIQPLCPSLCLGESFRGGASLHVRGQVEGGLSSGCEQGQWAP